MNLHGCAGQGRELQASNRESSPGRLVKLTSGCRTGCDAGIECMIRAGCDLTERKGTRLLDVPHVVTVALALMLSIGFTLNRPASAGSPPPDGRLVGGSTIPVKQSASKESSRIRQLTKQAQKISKELSKLVIRDLGGDIALPKLPSVQYTFITIDTGETQSVVVIDGLVNGKLARVGCRIDPPGVSCPAPCPPC